MAAKEWASGWSETILEYPSAAHGLYGAELVACCPAYGLYVDQPPYEDTSAAPL